MFDLINSTVNKTFLVFMLLLCSYNSARFFLKNKAMSFAKAEKKNYLAQFPNDFTHSQSVATISYMRTLFYVIAFIFSYCLKHYPHKI